MMLLVAKRCTWWWFVLFLLLLLQDHSLPALAARCEGKANLDVIGSQVCGNFFNETSCNNAFDSSLCRWDAERGDCIVDVMPSSSAYSCSGLTMIGNPQDCNNIQGCYWAEIPVWVWLAINLPVWLFVAGACLFCYRRHFGPSPRIQVYDRSESMTIGDDDNSSRSLTDNEQQERIITQEGIIFGNNPSLPPSVVVHSTKAIIISESDEASSSNETSVLEIIEEGDA